MTENAPQFTWDHIHILTLDAEGAANWFSDVLGADIVKSPVRVEANLGPLKIFFQEVAADADVASAPVSPHMGVDHFALSVKDIDHVAASLKAKGVVVTKEPFTPRPGVRIFFIQGPSGISIELLERDQKYT